MIRRANSEAPLPAGQTASNTHTGSAPCPAGQGSGRKEAAASFPPCEMRVCDRMARGGEKTANPYFIPGDGAHLAPQGQAAPPASPYSPISTSPSPQAPDPQIYLKFPSSKFRFPKAPPKVPSPRPPKTPQAAGPCSWACRRVCALPPEQKRNEAPKPPARGAWVREYGANGTGRRPCRPPARGAGVRLPGAEGTDRRPCRPAPAQGSNLGYHSKCNRKERRGHRKVLC